jgi:hypothetical protein
MPDLDLLAGVLVGNRRDRLDDDLLEELLRLGMGLGIRSLKPSRWRSLETPLRL